MPTPVDIAPARGKLGVMLVGMGAVSTTTIAGVMAIRKGLAKPIGSLTQMGTVRLGKRTEGRSPKITEVVPLAGLDDLVFGAWDIFSEDCYSAARTAGVIEPSLLEKIRPELEENDPSIPSSMIYAYAAIREGIPYANAAPNLTADIPALVALAAQTGSPLAGKDMKTGQTLIKTIVAPGLKARLLGVQGWYSTNILGNRDGEVLDDPESFKTKEESKKSVLDYILQPQLYPDLYDHLCHLVRINYYPPRGDNKEGWDNIDLVGWLGYPMQLKINFLCRDSILAAPIVLDVA